MTMAEPTIYSRCDIRGRDNLTLGEDVILQQDVWIDILKTGKVVIGKGSNIGRRSVIGCGKSVTIGEYVLFGPNVYVNDMDHEYKDIITPIMYQGTTDAVSITIGDGTWCGINSVIMASVGKHCVIGANSVVTHDIPDYCVAVGAPAKIIKRYNFFTKQWEKY